jgi:tetratricopeptide (TPR) repeat protein
MAAPIDSYDRSAMGCLASARRLSGLKYYESGLHLKQLIDAGAIPKLHEQDVIRCFELAINDQYAPAYVALGDLLRERGETDAAIAAYQNGIKANYIGAYSSYGQLLASQNRLDEMVPIYQKAIQQYPNASNLVGLQIGLGTVLEKLKRFDEAAAAYRKAIGIDSQSLYTYFSLGDVLRQQGKSEEALQIYGKAAEIVRPDSLASPGSVFSYAQVGDMLRDRGQYDLAIVTYQQYSGHLFQRKRIKIDKKRFIG